jgi:serine/threonine-protein kinase
MGGSVNGYQVLDKIKDGSVGTVWRVRDAKGRILAMKRISEKNSALGRKLREFEREATLTAKLSHPNIIRVFDYVPAKPQPFFVMEYFESENLKVAMARMPERVNKREFAILLQLAQALEHVHARGIIHKDLKPENVLVAPDAHIRLIDFSLAKTKWDRWLQFGKRVEGTPAYMAPEQIRGERCDARTDVYAFGVLTYELLTKQPLFAAPNERGVMEKHLREYAPPMGTRVSTIAPELNSLVLRMLAKRPDDRPADMSIVIHELSKWVRKDTIIRMRQVKPVSRAAPDAPVELASTVA